MDAGLAHSRPLFWAWLALFGAILVSTLLLPGFIGMGDNGDFPKVAGPLCLASHPEDRFFHPQHERAKEHCYDPHLPTSASLLAWIASQTQQAISGDRNIFDIRWLGALYGMLLLAVYASVLTLLWPLHPVSRFFLSAIALWILTDVALLAYLNSFYSDVPAILGGLGAVFAAVHVVYRWDSPRTKPMILFLMASLLFITSKAQHAVLGPLPAALALAYGFFGPKRKRQIGIIAGLALLAATSWMLVSTPEWYKSLARFNIVFSKILTKGVLAENAALADDLAELGLEAEDARYIGLNSFAAGGPMDDPRWAQRFRERTSYWRVLRFYLRHPAIVSGILKADFVQQGWQRRALGLANFQKGRPEGAIATGAASWSTLRTWAFWEWPWHVLLWLVLAPLLLAVWAKKAESTALRLALAWILPAVSLAALGEFCVASLADSPETSRHLLLFHIFTDASFFLGCVCIASMIEGIERVRIRVAAAALVTCGFTAFGVWALQPFASAIDDSSHAISYSGKWSAGAFGGAFRGTLTYTGEPGATARLSFEGSELEYGFTKAFNRGVAEVLVDGETRATVDLYDPQLVWQASATIGGLKPGRHDVEIRVLGRRHAASSGDVVDIDFLKGR